MNTTIYGSGFSEATKRAVWNKGKSIQGYAPNKYRKDTCGAWMQYDAYGDVASKFGWEIDHAKPTSKGGTDDLANLQPLHWKNNRGKGDDWPNWSCSLSHT